MDKWTNERKSACSHSFAKPNNKSKHVFQHFFFNLMQVTYTVTNYAKRAILFDFQYNFRERILWMYAKENNQQNIQYSVHSSNGIDVTWYPHYRFSYFSNSHIRWCALDFLKFHVMMSRYVRSRPHTFNLPIFIFTYFAKKPISLNTFEVRTWKYRKKFHYFGWLPKDVFGMFSLRHLCCSVEIAWVQWSVLTNTCLMIVKITQTFFSYWPIFKFGTII